MQHTKMQKKTTTSLSTVCWMIDKVTILIFHLPDLLVFIVNEKWTSRLTCKCKPSSLHETIVACDGKTTTTTCLNRHALATCFWPCPASKRNKRCNEPLKSIWKVIANKDNDITPKLKGGFLFFLESAKFKFARYKYDTRQSRYLWNSSSAKCSKFWHLQNPRKFKPAKIKTLKVSKLMHIQWMDF